jgi:aromatic ring-opening dioxygenase catalytic subunit (LigB family)
VSEGKGEAEIGRRQALLAAVAGMVALSQAQGCASEPLGAPRAPAEPAEQEAKKAMKSEHSQRMPVVFLPHGGGPWPFVDLGMPQDELDSLAEYLRSAARVPKEAPRALLVISAHWEERVPTVTTSAAPPMLYDYYGFPEESYRVQWPAPGEPALAANIQKLLADAGIESAADPKRGYDHGTFVPLKLMYPEARTPTVQLSLKAGLDPSEHLAIGRALSSLRDQGVFIVGSGMTFHNMQAFRGRGGAQAQAQAFDTWLQATGTAPEAERTRALTAWTEAPSARYAHPREEHLLPLMVVAGAAGSDVGSVPYRGKLFGLPFSAYHFG